MNVVPIDGPIEAILPMGTIVKLKVVPKVWINPNGFGVTFTIKKIKKEPVSGGIPRGVWDIDSEPSAPQEREKMSFVEKAMQEDEKAPDSLQVVDSDEEDNMVDPDSEYATPSVAEGAAAEESPAPKKGRTKVTKK
jgi:hypothetical protein